MGSESGSTPLDAAGGAEEVVATVVVEAGLREEANEAALIIDVDLPTVEVDFAVRRRAGRLVPVWRVAIVRQGVFRVTASTDVVGQLVHRVGASDGITAIPERLAMVSV